jgi:hypothetical protein
MNIFKQVTVIALSVLTLAVSAPVWPSNVAPRESAQSVNHEELMQLLSSAPQNSAQFAGRRIAIVAGNGASGFEVATIYDYLTERGAKVDLLAPRSASVAPAQIAVKAIDLVFAMAGECQKQLVTLYVDEARALDYDAVFLPNGLKASYRATGDLEVFSFLREARQQNLKIVAVGAARERLARPTWDWNFIAPTEDEAMNWAFDLPKASKELASALQNIRGAQAN